MMLSETPIFSGWPDLRPQICPFPVRTLCTVRADCVAAARVAASSSAALLKAARPLLYCSKDVAADRVSGMLVGAACRAA